MNIDWSSFFGDGRNEDSTYLKFDTFSLKLSPDFPEERNYSLIVPESGRYTEYFSLLMYQWPDEDDYDEVFAFIYVEDYESGECRKVVDFFGDDISKASAETPDIIPIMQDFREFLLKNGFECGGYIPTLNSHEHHSSYDCIQEVKKMNIQESADKMVDCIFSGSEFSVMDLDSGQLEISKESLVAYEDFGFRVLTFSIFWNVNNPKKFGIDESYILLGAGEVCDYTHGTREKMYKLDLSDIPDACTEILHAVSELCKSLDAHGFKRDIEHLRDLPRRKRREYRENVCSGKEFQDKNELESYAKIKYLFDHNKAERIAEWLSEYHGGGHYSNKELAEIRNMLINKEISK